LGLLDTRFGLVIVLMLINLPIIVWMLYTYFREIPGEILDRGWRVRASSSAPRAAASPPCCA
jgi:ABC-type spermidine/putrescine transport system permease subunit I